MLSKGFTLIEVIVVIAILGLLAAFAVPKYIDVQRTARINTLTSVEGSLRSMAHMVLGLAITQGQTGDRGEVQSQYGIIETKWGYPEAYAGTNLGMSELVSAEGGLVYQGSSNSARYGFDHTT